MKTKILEQMKATGMIPVYFNNDFETARSVMEACYRGGVRVFEFTNRGENALEVFKKLVSAAKQLDGLYIGIGTLFTVDQAESFIGAGADFIVSPIFNEELNDFCLQREVLFIPGCATLTEIVNATAAGASLVKLFPANTIGADFVSAILPVLPHLQIMPTGGVEPTKASLTSWFSAGVACVGMGSQLLNRKSISEGNWTALRHQVTDCLTIIRQIRQNDLS